MIIKGDSRPDFNNNELHYNITHDQRARNNSEKKKEVLTPQYVKWFSELSYKDVNIAGGKGANLGEMYQNKFPVPPGFVIAATAYTKFLEVTGLDKKIYEILSRLNLENTQELEREANEIQKMIIAQEMPERMKEEIVESYEHLNVNEDSLKGASADALAILKRGREPPFVAVRSSATAEDGVEASFAGQNSTFLNVKGNTKVIEAVKGCWASLFTARSVYYRVKKGFKHEETAIAVVIQVMVNSDRSGVMFTKDPVKNTNNVVIESVFGLGEGIVSGMINPDHFEVNEHLEITNSRLSTKKIAIIRNSSGKNETVTLTPERSEQQSLTNYEVKKLAQYGMELEKHYGRPQDIEFAVDTKQIYIVQTRPITTLANREDYEKKAKENEMSGEEILSGISASPGVGSGVVKIVHDMSELNKIKKGDVLVTQMTNPDMVVAMQKANAILTDEGGLTSHAAIVSREMGIPCIVGSRVATTTLKEGEIITIDGYTGKVYRGIVEGKKVTVTPIVQTKTKIKVIVDLPDYAQRAAITNASAVGLTRMEGIIAEGGKHPQYFLKNDKLEEYEEIIYKGVKKISSYFDEVRVRTSDIRSDEYEHLEGAPEWHEANPMLGMHGIRASLKYPALLKAELRALKRVAQEGKKIGVMMPQIISVEEVKKTKQYMQEVGLHDNIELGIMVETPAAVQVIEEMCDEGIKFISFGTNDLTQFTLAIDRGNEDCQSLYSEMHPAIIKQIKHVIEVCKARGVETSICGQAGSRKEMAKILVEAGIDSISVNADAAGELSIYIKELEEEMESNKNSELIKNEIDPIVNNNGLKSTREEALTDRSLKEEAIVDARKKEEAISYKKEEMIEDKREEYDDSVHAEPLEDYSTYQVEVEEAVIVETKETVEESGIAETNQEEAESITTTTTTTTSAASYEEEIIKELSGEEETAGEGKKPEEEKHIFMSIF
ncbi:MAG: phosphoenolpyruvate synthase [Nanoarchaeota archaeon]